MTAALLPLLITVPMACAVGGFFALFVAEAYGRWPRPTDSTTTPDPEDPAQP